MSRCTTSAIRKVMLMQHQIDELEEANNRLSRRKRITKKQLQNGGILTIESSKSLASQASLNGKRERNEDGNPVRKKRVETRRRRCGKCGEIGHNARTCENEVESISSDNSD